MSEWILVLSLTYDRPYSRILFESRDSLLLNFYIPITKVLFWVSHIAFVTASPWMYYIPQKSILPFFFFLSLVLLLFLLFLLLLLCCFILYPFIMNIQLPSFLLVFLDKLFALFEGRYHLGELRQTGCFGQGQPTVLLMLFRQGNLLAAVIQLG